MQRFCTGVLAGCLLSLFLPALPVFFKIIFSGALLLCWACRQYLAAGISVFLLCWHWQLQSYIQAQTAIFNHSQGYHTVQIAAWRELDVGDISMQLIIQQGEAKGYQLNVRWRNAPQVEVGQQWRLALRLRPLVGYSNPGSRQRETQALLQGIIAEGYVEPGQPAMLLRAGSSKRQWIIAQLANWTQSLETAPLLIALTVGERQFSNELWLGIQHSGLGHILTISGLHIGLVFGWGYLLSGLLLKKCQLRQRKVWQLLSALLPALAYAWLAGFAIPTIRAGAALLLVIGSRILLRPLNGRYAWQLLVAILLLLNPFWVLSYSFWLSVLAVAVIIFMVWWLPLPSTGWLAKLRYFCLFHLLLTTIMSLIGLAFFGGVSTLALLSNLLFVSWCSLVAIPVLLFALCWSLLGLPYMALWWQFCELLFMPLWHWLNWSAAQAVWWSVPSLGVAVSLLLAAALLVALAMRLAWRPLLLVFGTLGFAVLVPRPVTPQLLLFDSGQSTVLLARHATLNWLYLDATTAQLESVVRQTLLPQLRYQRVQTLGPVLIPNLERDMQPALELLLRYYPMARVYSASPVLPNSYPCAKLPLNYPVAGFRHWSLPAADPCLISADFADWRLLLPGRLSAWQEQQLLAQYPTLSADLYLLADYGRPSANSLAWLTHLSPVTLLLSASQRGAYRYPLQNVEQRINLLGLPLYHAGEQGALTFIFTADSFKIVAERQQQQLRWLEKPAE